MKLFHTLRENIKLFVWDYIDIVQTILKYISIFVSFFTVSVIAYFYGFEQTEQTTFFCNIVFICSLIFYVLKYLLSTLFSTHSSSYIKKNKFQGIMILLIIIWFISVYLFDFNFYNYLLSDLEFSGLENITLLFVQLYFFVMMLFDLSNIGSIFTKFKLGAGGWMITSFILIILLGTFLLMLPEMTTEGIRFIDALFTSTSACCVTGLTVVETATAFTFKGQFIIMMLIQIGGINIICFATYLASSYRGNSLQYQSVMKEMLSTSLYGTKSLIKEIFLYSIIIELIGSLAIFIHYNYNHYYSDSIAENIFFSVFHTIAAFNNAGFSIVEGGMTSPLFRQDHFVQYIIALLIFLGGIGFIAIADIFNNLHHNNSKKSIWHRLQVMTKLSIKVSSILVFTGAIAFFAFEFNNASADTSFSDRICTAIFASISCRTAGFATIDNSLFSTPTILIFIILMFIGASPSSTGGGIKTTTFYIIIKSAISTMKGKKQVTIYNRSIPFNQVDRSYSIVLFTLSLIFTGTLIISISDPQFTLQEIVYEAVSAIGTVGLTLGITTKLTIIGKSVLILLMFVGRITVLTLALSVARKTMYTNYSLARTNINLS